MAKDLTIRELNRPQISQDNQLGFQKIVRKYVVEGDRVNQSELTDPTDPLFLGVGTTDTEYTDHYLVNQQITPATGDVDRAYLTREFIQLRNQFFSESTNESNDLVRVNRKYAVLRSGDTFHGYGLNWDRHPNNTASASYSSSFTPWDYQPTKVSAPGSLAHSYANNNGFTSPPQVLINGAVQSLYDYLVTDVGTSGMGNWLPGRASVSQYMPGLDIWDVEWITHATPYWTLGTAKGGGSKSIPITVVDFDEHGMKLEQYGRSSQTQYQTVARTNVFFYIGDDIPTSLGNITGGVDSSFSTSQVHTDFTMLTNEGRAISFKKDFKNAVFKWSSSSIQNGDVVFPNYDPNLDPHKVGTRRNNEIIFDKTPKNGWSTGTGDGAPVFQGQAILRIGGRISWTKSSVVGRTLGHSSEYFGSVGTKITPLFSHRGTKIWKIEITYIG